MKKVVTSNDHVSLSKIEEALHSKNIFFYSKDEGAEEFLKILLRNVISGIRHLCFGSRL